MNLWQRIRAAFIARQPGQERIYISPRQGGVLVSQDTALTHAAVWACVRVISETVAALPWHVYRRTEQGREAAESHPVHWLLNNQPNDEMTAFAFREALVAHALTWGNGYAEIQRDGAGRPSKLWLIAPDRCEAKRTESGALVYELTADDGTKSTAQPSQILHLHGLGFDGLVGYSPVRMASRSIGLGIAQDAFSQSFYGNGTAFGGLVEVPANMNPQQIGDMETYLNDKHRGPDKAFKVRVVANGMKYHNVSMPMTDAQFIESRKFSVTEVARWFRVPPHKIADLERSTNNNIEHQSIEFVTDTIVPWVTRLEQEANVKLFGARAMGSTYTKMPVNALMRGDAAGRATFYRTMTQIGAMSINEVRALEELNGIGPAGDEQLVQLNQTTLDRLVAEPPEPKPVEQETPANPEEPADEAQEALPSNVFDLADAVRGIPVRDAALNFSRNQA